jgi:hypothetical protein
MGERFSGPVEVTRDAAKKFVTILLDGKHAAIAAGGSAVDGAISVRNKEGEETVGLTGDNGSVVVGGRGTDGSGGGVDGSLFIRNTDNVEILSLLARLALFSLGSAGAAGVVTVHGSGAGATVRIDGADARVDLGGHGTGGKVNVQNSAGGNTVHVDGAAARVDLGGHGTGGEVTLHDGAGGNTIDILGQHGRLVLGGGAVQGPHEREIPGAWEGGAAGSIYVRDFRGKDTICLDGTFARMWLGANGQHGHVYVRTSEGKDTIHLDGETGDIVLLNADCAEDFTVEDAAAAGPGTVMVLSQDGKLRPSDREYDTGVVGVVAGAGGLRPGIVLDRRNPSADRLPVALMGKAFCKADASNGPIVIGDMLTTSSTVGHAMRVEQSSRAFGAVIGKALAPLPRDRGLVPILVALQ